MFLTKGQAESRLSSERNLALRFGKEESQEASQEDSNPERATVNIEEHVIPMRGRNKVALTEELRTEIAIRTRSGEPQANLVSEYNLAPSTVHSIEKGKTKGINEDKVKEVIDTVKDRALDRLMSSLGLLTNDKLSGCTAKDLSIIASNMGRVVEKMNPKSDQPDNINLIIYAPELKQERAFKVIEI